MSDWAAHLIDPRDDLEEWAYGYMRKVRTGQLILQYLGRVMDGQLGGVGACELSLQEECRDLSLEIHLLSTPLSSAVAGLEVSLKWVRM